MDGYFAAKNDAETEFVEKKSRFITHVKCVSSQADAEAFISEIKKKYPDARHNCWAYRIRQPLSERYSDDGEPQGTAGVPMLEVLRKEDIFDICVVVTRYFGGILLGASGLVRAYAKGCADGMHLAGKAVYRPARRLNLEIPYKFYDSAVLKLGMYEHIMIEKNFHTGITLSVWLPSGQTDLLCRELEELSGGQIICRSGEAENILF